MSSTIITEAGEKLLLDALSTGTSIKLDFYKVTDAYGYQPSTTDTDIQGNIVWASNYTGSLPLEFDYESKNQLNIYVTFPPKCGPFNIGTIGLWSGDTLVCIMVRNSPRRKEYQPLDESDLFKEEIILIMSSISLAIETVDVSSIFYYGVEIYKNVRDLPQIEDASNNFAIVKEYETDTGILLPVIVYKNYELREWIPVGLLKINLKNINMSIR